MKDLNRVLIVISIFILSSCRAQTVEESLKLISERKELLLEIASNYSNKGFYNYKVNDKILWKPNTNKYNNYSDIIEDCRSLLEMALTHGAKNEQDRIDFVEIFNREEILHMLGQLDIEPNKSWNRYIDFDLQIEHTTKEKIEKEYFLSLPVFTKDRKYAFYYQEQQYGGSIVIYQKIKDLWKSIGSSQVWVN